MKHIKTINILFAFILIFVTARGQRYADTTVESTRKFIIKFFNDSLNFKTLAAIDCKESNISLMILEFKFNKKQKFYEIDIKNDTAKKVTAVFSQALKSSKGKWNKLFIRRYKGYHIFLPILNLHTLCANSQWQSQSLKNEIILSDKEVSSSFREYINIATTNFMELFGKEITYRKLKRVFIFPTIRIGGFDSNQLRK